LLAVSGWRALIWDVRLSTRIAGDAHADADAPRGLDGNSKQDPDREKRGGIVPCSSDQA
jgi:hypothetical protein